MGEIVDATRHAGFGFLAALLALCSLPLPGVGLPFGLAIAFLGLQMIWGQEHPWLPSRIRRHVVSQRTLTLLGDKLARGTRWLEKLVRPRWSRLTRRVAFRLVGVGMVWMGLGLALPLPIPGTNMMFIAPVLIYSVGLLEDDGVLIALGHLTIAIHVGLGLAFWEVIARALAAIF